MRILLTCFLWISFNELRFRANKYPERAKNIQLAILQIPYPIKRCRYGANWYCVASLKLLCMNTTIITSMVFSTMILSLRYRVIKCLEFCEGFPNQNNVDIVNDRYKSFGRLDAIRIFLLLRNREKFLQ